MKSIDCELSETSKFLRIEPITKKLERFEVDSSSGRFSVQPRFWTQLFSLFSDVFSKTIKFLLTKNHQNPSKSGRIRPIFRFFFQKCLLNRFQKILMFWKATIFLFPISSFPKTFAEIWKTDEYGKTWGGGLRLAPT